MMKKLLLYALIFLNAVSPSRPQAELGSLTVVGDSIASGYGLADYVPGNDYSAPESFGNLLGAQSSHYENHAVDGRTSDELLNALSVENGQLAEAVADSENVIISIGGNDFLQPMISAVKTQALTDMDFFGAVLDGSVTPGTVSDYSNRIMRAALSAAEAVDIDKTLDNIGEIVERIHVINPRAKIILMTVYDPFAGNVLLTAASEVAEERLNVLNNGILALAEEDVSVADVYSAFKGHESEYTNIARLDVHPNADGHYKIYELIYELLYNGEGRQL